MDAALLANGVAQVKKELDKLDEAVRAEITHCNGLRKGLAVANAKNKNMAAEAAKLQLRVHMAEDESSDLGALQEILTKQLHAADKAAADEKARADMR